MIATFLFNCFFKFYWFIDSLSGLFWLHRHIILWQEDLADLVLRTNLSISYSSLCTLLAFSSFFEWLSPVQFSSLLSFPYFLRLKTNFLRSMFILFLFLYFVISNTFYSLYFYYITFSIVLFWILYVLPFFSMLS